MTNLPLHVCCHALRLSAAALMHGGGLALVMSVMTATPLLAGELRLTLNDSVRLDFTGQFRYRASPIVTSSTARHSGTTSSLQFNRNQFLPRSAHLRAPEPTTATPGGSASQALEGRSDARARLIEPSPQDPASQAGTNSPANPSTAASAKNSPVLRPLSNGIHADLEAAHQLPPLRLPATTGRTVKQDHYDVAKGWADYRSDEVLDLEDLGTIAYPPSRRRSPVPSQFFVATLLDATARIPFLRNDTKADNRARIPQSDPQQVDVVPAPVFRPLAQVSADTLDPNYTATSIVTAAAKTATQLEDASNDGATFAPLPAANPKRVAIARAKKRRDRRRAQSRRRRATALRLAKAKPKSKATNTSTKSSWSRTVFSDTN